MISTVLIVDGMATNRIVLKVKLGAAGYRTLTAADAEGCLDLVRRERPDLILLDCGVPGPGEEISDGLGLLRALRGEPDTSRGLIVMLCATDDADLRLSALRAGADECFSKRIDDQTLFARLRSLVRAQEDGGLASDPDAFGSFGFAEPVAGFVMPGIVAVVTSRPETGLYWRHHLSSHSTDRFIYLPPDQVFRQTEGMGPTPDVYLIDSGLTQDGGGLTVMSSLLSRHETRHAKVCILNTGTDPALPAMAFDLGASDLVASDLNVAEIALRLAGLVRRKREADRLRARVKDNLRLAMIDPLTGIPNRRAGLAQLACIADRSVAAGQTFALLMLDLDRFKSVNDRFGHAAGDAVLVEVARRLTTCLRASDLIARIGGEEFLICLPDTSLADSRHVAERLCREIEANPITLNAQEQLRVTISIGMALSHEVKDFAAAPLVSEIFDRADRALLKAKGAGRNQVTISRSAA